MPKTVLTVHADAAVRSLRNKAVRQAGFRVIEAATGKDALKLAAEKRPTLVVLPTALPGTDGWAVCKRLKADPRTASIPVLHISGPGESHRAYPKSLESGADAWLREPAEPPVLAAVVKALIRTRSGGARTRKTPVSVARVTERKRAERERERFVEQLAAKRELLNTVLAATPAGINLVRGGDLTYEWVNPAFQSIAFGKEMLGRTVEEVWPEVHPLLSQLYRRVLETGEPYEAVDEQFHIRRAPSGPLEPRYFTWTLVRVRLPGEQGWGVLNTVIETTERVRAEERLRQAQKLESIGLLAGGVAHDFNNLLVGVVGNASLALDMLPADHPVVELLDGVVKSGEQAAHLTRQMLAYAGKGKFLMEALTLSELIPDMSGLVRPSISKKIALHLDLDGDLPPIEADRGQVQQVFMNLALNAAEAVGSNDGLISVRTGTQRVDGQYLRLHPEAAELRPGEYVFLEVRDTGHGMDDATRAKIFDPFFSTKFTGRGLGLAALAGIVRSHKGAIHVATEPGKGSCFTVLFPAAARSAGEPAAVARAATLQGVGTMLVVDDEPVVREMTKKALERQGYTVLLADSGLAAIDICRRHASDIALAVLDLSMPNMSGEEALPEMRKIRPKLKVLVTSGYSEAETMASFKGQRVSGFIQKPYTATRIAQKVKVCCRRPA